MATPLRRRNSAPTEETTADDYAPPRRGRGEGASMKYNAKDLEALTDEELTALADLEDLDPEIGEPEDIIKSLLVIAWPNSTQPRRGRASSFAPREESEREDSSEAEKPAATRKARGGFSSFKKEAAKSSNFTKHWKPSEGESLVKFLDPGPFDTYGEHSLFKELHEGQRVFICVEDDVPCPIHAVGHENTRAIALFNVVVCDPDTGRWKQDVLEAGPGLTGKIEATQKSKLAGGLDKGYFTMRADPKPGTNFLDYYVEPVSERQLSEVFDVDPLTETQLSDYETKKKGEGYVQYPSMEALNKAAKALQQG